MTVRNLDYLLKPSSIAVIGASRRPNTIGAVLARNLFHARFKGPIMPVNPHEQAIEGVLTYPSVTALPLVPDLAILCTPAETVPGLIAELGARGTKAAVIISAGFGDADGQALRDKALVAARPHLMRLLGPNSLGLIVPGLGLNASFAHVAPNRGEIALVAQSGAVITAMIDWAATRNIGFSHLISIGDTADVDFGDLIDHLANEPDVRAILLYAEAVVHARKFMSAARAAARQKPVIVIKAGRSAEAARAAATHTGALVGTDAVYSAAFRRAGVLRVNDLGELFDAVQTLSIGAMAAFGRAGAGRLAILTNGGGIGVLATDALIADGGRLAELAPETTAALDQVLPKLWSRENPIDIISDAPAKRYADALEILMKDRSIDAILAINCPTAIGDSFWAAEAVAETYAKLPRHSRTPLLTCWLGDGAQAESRRLFAAHHIPTYTTPNSAVRGFMHLVRHARNQDLLMQTPPSVPDSFEIDPERARALIDDALRDGRDWLTEFEAKQVIAAYGIPVVATHRAADPDAAADAARSLGGPVALKISSPDLTHKSAIGGVVLDLGEPEQVGAEATRMRERIAVLEPDARIDGFTVQEMVRGADQHELVVGMTEDRLFGPVLMFGLGGTGVEVTDDRALALPPLNLMLAHDLMARTRVWRLLQGVHGRPAVATDAIADVLLKLSQLVIDFPEIVELDINPLVADPNRVIALDARVRVAIPTAPGARRLAIRPYPKNLEEIARLPDGTPFLLRPVRPEDEPGLQALFERMTPEDIRLRFFAPKKHLSHYAAARLTQIDYDREMGLVAVALDRDADGQPATSHGPLRGIVRIAADPDNQHAEFAVMVQSDFTGHGLGTLLMRKILDHARSRGIGEVTGQVLRENTGMLKLAKSLGFRRRPSTDDPGVVEVALGIADR